jgi:hypothetical protein
MHSNGKKTAKANWALIMRELSDARVRANKLDTIAKRVLKLVEKSQNKQHLYECAGDLILSAPDQITGLESSLDRLSYMFMDEYMDDLKWSMKTDDRFDFNKVKNKKIAHNVATRFFAREQE